MSPNTPPSPFWVRSGFWAGVGATVAFGVDWLVSGVPSASLANAAVVTWGAALSAMWKRKSASIPKR